MEHVVLQTLLLITVMEDIAGLISLLKLIMGLPILQMQVGYAMAMKLKINLINKSQQGVMTQVKTMELPEIWITPILQYKIILKRICNL